MLYYTGLLYSVYNKSLQLNVIVWFTSAIRHMAVAHISAITHMGVAHISAITHMGVAHELTCSSMHKWRNFGCPLHPILHALIPSWMLWTSQSSKSGLYPKIPPPPPLLLSCESPPPPPPPRNTYSVTNISDDVHKSLPYVFNSILIVY